MSRSSRPAKQHRATMDEPHHGSQHLTSKMTVPAIPHAAVAGSSDLLRVILGKIADGVTAQAPDGKLLYANDTAAKIIGCASGKEMMETPITEIMSRFEVLTEDERPFDLSQLPSRLVMMGSDYAEARLKFRIRATGEMRSSEVKATAIRDAEGKLYLVANVFHDITVHELAEEELRRSEERYRAFVQQSSEGIWRCELEEPVDVSLPAAKQVEAFFRSGRMAECNDAMAHMYGFAAAEDIIGVRLTDLMPQNDPRNVAYLTAFVESGYRMHEAESHEVDKDGRPKVFLNNLVGIIENGRIQRAWGTQRDVTDQKRIEGALRESEHRFVQFMQHLPGLAWIKDAEGAYVYVNDAAEKAFRLQRKDLYGHTDEEVFPPETAAVFREHDLQALESKSGLQIVETLEHEDGLHHSLVSKFPIPGPDGKASMVGGMAVDITDRLKMEQSLRQSEQKFRELAEGMPQMVWSTAPDGQLSYANRRWCEYTGLSIEGVAQFMDVIHPDDLARTTDIWGHATQTGQFLELEHRLRRASDGQYRWHLVRGVPVKDEKGKLTQWVGTSTDIHDQKEAEEALLFLSQAHDILASSLDYHTTLASFAKLVVPRLADWCSIQVLEPDGRLEQVAVTHKDETKLQEALRLGKDYPSDYTNTTRGIGKVLHTGKPDLIEHITDDMVKMAARDERHLKLIRWLGLTSSIMVPLTARGKTIGVLTLLTAESGKRFGPKDLSLAEELAERAALAVDNARLFTEAQQEIAERARAEAEVRRLNEELEERVHERTQALEGQIAERLRAEEKERASLERMRNMIDHLPMGAIAMDEEERVLHVNQEFCTMFGLQIAPSSMIGEDAKFYKKQLKTVITDHDAYIRKLQELRKTDVPFLGQEITLKDGRIICRDYIPIVESGVRRGHLALYRDITHERRVDASKSEFMSLASHQLRTPLTAIRWAIGRIEKHTKSDPAQSRVLAAARRATEHMANTITAMLTISRIEAGKIEPKLADVRLCDLLEELKSERLREYESKNQTFSIECSHDVVVRTDLLLLKEILLNLLGNAIKYTPDGGRISVSSHAADGRVLIHVTDTGYGIPQSQHNRVFQKFFRADNAIDLDPEGNGLGLYLAYVTVRLLGGDISFQSQESKGTTFSLSFPIHPPSV